MPVTRITSRDFNRDVGRAMRTADNGPVFITDRGEPAYVLLRHDAYRQLTGGGSTIRELLDQPGMEAIDFDAPEFGSRTLRPAPL